MKPEYTFYDEDKSMQNLIEENDRRKEDKFWDAVDICYEMRSDKTTNTSMETVQCGRIKCMP